MRWLLLTVLIFSTSSFASELAATDHPPGTLKFTPVEFYKFNLGGDSGQYTNWEKLQIAQFDGLATTFEITEIKGKPKDKWASIARVILFGEGEGKSRKMLSVTFTADRKSKEIGAEISRGADSPHHPVDVNLSAGKSIKLSVLVTAPGELTIQVDDLSATIESEFEVKAISVIGSGLDVAFSSFDLLQKAHAK